MTDTSWVIRVMNEATTPDLTSDKPAGGETTEAMLQQLARQDGEWGRHEDRFALFLIASRRSQPPPRNTRHALSRGYAVTRLRQMPGKAWEDYRDNAGSSWTPSERASRHFGARVARRWLTAMGIELPAQALRAIYSRESILARCHNLLDVGGEDTDLAARGFLDEDGPGYDSIGSVGSAGSDD